MKSIYITEYSIVERIKEPWEYDETVCSEGFVLLQPLEGECCVTLSSGKEFLLPEMGVLAVPSYRLARVRHLAGNNGKRKELKLTFNVMTDGCRMDDVFAFPDVLPPDDNEKIFVLLSTLKDNENIFRAYSNLYRLLELLLKSAEVKKDRYFIRDAYEHIEQNISKQIKVSDLAGVLGVSEPTVYRMFNEAVGCSPIEYINMYRIGKAHSMLGSCSEMKIKDIARKCGFEDQLYFSKLFSKVYELSPRAYRENLHMVASQRNGDQDE